MRGIEAIDTKMDLYSRPNTCMVTLDYFMVRREDIMGFGGILSLQLCIGYFALWLF